MSGEKVKFSKTVLSGVEPDSLEIGRVDMVEVLFSVDEKKIDSDKTSRSTLSLLGMDSVLDICFLK